MRDLHINWPSLEEAFENNAPEVRSYLHLGNGDVVRIVNGKSDPDIAKRVAQDISFSRIPPISSREQYSWMETFISTVDDHDLRDALREAIGGAGAFRRFKDILSDYPDTLDRWRATRRENVRRAAKTWLDANDINPIDAPTQIPASELAINTLLSLPHGEFVAALRRIDAARCIRCGGETPCPKRHRKPAAV